jgi:hypothetical protein
VDKRRASRLAIHRSLEVKMDVRCLGSRFRGKLRLRMVGPILISPLRVSVPLLNLLPPKSLAVGSALIVP